MAVVWLAHGCVIGWDEGTGVGPPPDDDDHGGGDDDDNGGGDDDDDDDNSPGNNSCDTALDLGLVPDDGSFASVDDCLGEGEWIWYHFLAGDMLSQDVNDGGDQWGVNILFAYNEDDAFKIVVHRGDCESMQCPELGPYDTYTIAMDQDPCGEGYNECVDDSTEFYVKVYSTAAGADCREFTLQVTNG